jgi:dipeptidyl aminopeptidase/acylaminoacyl peptidase
VLVAQGIVALCINSNDAYSYLPHPSGTVRRGPSTDGLRSDLDAWESAVDLLADRGMVDRAHVGISGASWSGRLVHYAISHSNYFAAAASAGAGDDDPGSYIFIGPKGSIYREGLERLKQLPSPRNDPQGRWKEVSPALNVDKINAPLLVQSSDTEYLLDLDLFTSMADADKAMELVVFSGESHLISQPRHKLAQYKRNVDWFRFWLQGAQDDTPEKRAQYRRWTTLRLRLSSPRTPP